MDTKFGKLISRDREGTLTEVYPEILIDDEVNFADRRSRHPVTNIGVANAIDNAINTAKDKIKEAFTSSNGGLRWDESVQRGYVDFSQMPNEEIQNITNSLINPNGAIIVNEASGKIDVDFSKLQPSDIVPLCDSGGGIVADTTNGKLRISFQNMNADGFSKLGVLPVANGGTGQTTVANIQAGKDGAGNTITATYVTLATAQNITGVKTFSAKPVLNQVGLAMTVKDTNAATTRTAQVLHANSDNAGYGINLGVGGSGNTVLGAGESCTAQLNELAGNASENLYLVADGNIYFKPNGNTWSNAKTVTLNSAGEMSGLSKVTATEFVGKLTGDVTGTFNGPCKGNADSATKLQTARTINGTSFDGSGNITTSSWGTARNIYISDSDGTNTGAAVSVNGAGNATLKLPGTIKASITGNVTGNCSGTSANVTGTVAIANGGTGATTRLGALKNLTNENVGTSAQHFLVITDSWGKGGYASVANAKSVLGISNVVNIDQSKAIKGITRSGTTFTYTCLDGTTGTFTQQDNNTVYTHPTTSGNKHIPSGGSSGQFLGWSADGTAKWVNNPSTNTPSYGVFNNTTNGLVPAPNGRNYWDWYLAGDGQWRAVISAATTSPESDRRLKQNFKDVSDDIIDIWGNVHWIQFLFKKEVSEKNEDAKIHTGLVVQDLHELYEKHGIDIKKYGITVHEFRETIPAQYDENGNLISQQQEAVDKWHLNYNEALAFEALYLRKKIKLLEERLTKLESKNN